ncbi:MAG: ComEA family DNA-binding protein [Sandaracinaceae bacterium]
MTRLVSIHRSLLLALGAFALVAGLTASAPSAHAQRGGRARVTEAPATPDAGVVNIQTATLDQLQLLPGIGPSKAQAIVAHREQRAFRRPEDIMRVRGIGRSTYRRLSSMITVQGPTTLTAPQRATRSSDASGAEPTEE